MGKKILLADDSITIQKVIELTFSDEDFDVITVGNGRLAIEKLPDVQDPLHGQPAVANGHDLEVLVGEGELDDLLDRDAVVRQQYLLAHLPRSFPASTRGPDCDL